MKENKQKKMKTVAKIVEAHAKFTESSSNSGAWLNKVTQMKSGEKSGVRTLAATIPKASPNKEATWREIPILKPRIKAIKAMRITTSA